MKLYIASTGIEQSIAYDIKSIVSDLKTAKRVDLNGPSTYSAAGYVNSLDSKISSIIKRIDKLQDVAKDTDKSYKRLINDSKKTINSVYDPNYKERDGFKYTDFDLDTSADVITLRDTYLRASDVVKDPGIDK